MKRPEKINKIFNWIKCKAGLHYGQSFVGNITTDDGVVLTIGWHQCERCGHSQIDFTYGS